MKSSVDELLHIADHDVNQWQPQVGLLRRHHFLAMLMLLTDNIQRRERIHLDSLTSSKMSGKELLHAFLGYAVYSLHGDKPSPFFTSLNRDKHRSQQAQVVCPRHHGIFCRSTKLIFGIFIASSLLAVLV